MRNSVRLVLTAVVAAGMCGPVAAVELLYVHNTFSGDISVIEIPKHEIVNTIDIGYYMDYVTPSPDQDILYVNRIESIGLDRAPNVGVSGELIALSTKTDKPLWRVELDGMPHHMSASKDGKHVFVPYYDTWYVAVVSVEEKRVIKKIAVGHGSHGTKLSPDGKRLYVGSMMNDTMTIIDTGTFEIIDQIPFNDGVRPFDFDDKEQVLYVQQSRLHGFEVVDLPKREWKKTVYLPDLPESVQLPKFYPHNVNHGIALTPDEELLFVNGSIVDYVAVYTHPDLQLIKTIPVGTEPNSIAFSKDGKYAYVTNRKSDDLSVISVEELEEVKRIKLGKYPQRMAVVTVPERDVD